jgi:hypothetical protein
VRKHAIVALALAAIASVSSAEPRWCAATSIREGRNLAYPPIAKAARVSGVVLERVIYLPDGTVKSFEFVSGPMMLSSALEKQVKDWSLETNAIGTEACESLVIADFRLVDSPETSETSEVDLSVPSILRLNVQSAPVLLIDPAAEVGRWPIFHRIGYTIKQAFAKIFRLKH